MVTSGRRLAKITLQSEYPHVCCSNNAMRIQRAHTNSCTLQPRPCALQMARNVHTYTPSALHTALHSKLVRIFTVACTNPTLRAEVLLYPCALHQKECLARRISKISFARRPTSKLRRKPLLTRPSSRDLRQKFIRVEQQKRASTAKKSGRQMKPPQKSPYGVCNCNRYPLKTQH